MATAYFMGDFASRPTLRATHASGCIIGGRNDCLCMTDADAVLDDMPDLDADAILEDMPDLDVDAILPDLPDLPDLDDD